MTSEIVKYKNSINGISFKKFSERELNIFMALVAQLHDKGCEPITTTFFELRQLTHCEKLDKNKFLRVLESVYKNVIGTSYTIEDERFITIGTIFREFRIDKDKEEVITKVDSGFEFLFNMFIAGQGGKWTKFTLQQYISIQGKYAKLLFQNLRQWRKAGYWDVSLNELIKRFGIPKGLTFFGFKDINRDIIKPAVAKCSRYFVGLRYELTKKNRKVVSIKFKWDRVIEDYEKEQLQLTMNTMYEMK